MPQYYHNFESYGELYQKINVIGFVKREYSETK